MVRHESNVVVALQKYPRYRCRSLTKSGLLKELGLPRNTLWEHASKVIKERMVKARRFGLLGNMQNANALRQLRRLSEIKARLKNVLPHLCCCGVIIRAKSRACLMCSIIEITQNNNKKKNKNKQLG